MFWLKLDLIAVAMTFTCRPCRVNAPLCFLPVRKCGRPFPHSAGQLPASTCSQVSPSVRLAAWLSPCRIQCRHVLYKRRTAVCCVLRDFNFISIWVELSQSDAKTKAITITKTSDYQCWVMLPEHCILFTKWSNTIVSGMKWIEYKAHHQHKKSHRIMKSDMLRHS